MAKKLFWIWLIILLLLNVLPLGNKVNDKLQTSLGEGRIRMDYVIHSITFICFAGIYFVKCILKEVIFKDRELPKLILLILISAIIFEGLQLALPYRAWNPMDLLSNLIGAIIASVIMLLIYQKQFIESK